MSQRPHALSVAMMLVVVAAGCRTTGQTPESAAKDLAFSSDSRNVAAFFTAPRPRVNTPVAVENDPEDIIQAFTGFDLD